MDPQPVDRIYECAFMPDEWPKALGELAAIATARVGFLYVSKGEILRFVGSSAFGLEVVRPLVESGVVARSERFRRLLAARHSGFLTEAEIFPAGDVADDLTYRTILYPRGSGHAAATAVTLPTGDSFTIALEREFTRGPVERDALDRLDAIRPDIARAATTSVRLQLERARATTQVLEALGLAALVFDNGGKVIAANPLIEAMPNEIRWLARDRLSLSDRNADLLLRGHRIHRRRRRRDRAVLSGSRRRWVRHNGRTRRPDPLVCAGHFRSLRRRPGAHSSIGPERSFRGDREIAVRPHADRSESCPRSGRGKDGRGYRLGRRRVREHDSNPGARRSGKDRLQSTDRRGRAARRSLRDGLEADLTAPKSLWPHQNCGGGLASGASWSAPDDRSVVASQGSDPLVCSDLELEND